MDFSGSLPLTWCYGGGRPGQVLAGLLLLESGASSSSFSSSLLYIPSPHPRPRLTTPRRVDNEVFKRSAVRLLPADQALSASQTNTDYVNEAELALLDRLARFQWYQLPPAEKKEVRRVWAL